MQILPNKKCKIQCVGVAHFHNSYILYALGITQLGISWIEIVSHKTSSNVLQPYLLFPSSVVCNITNIINDWNVHHLWSVCLSAEILSRAELLGGGGTNLLLPFFCYSWCYVHHKFPGVTQCKKAICSSISPTHAGPRHTDGGFLFTPRRTSFFPLQQ